MTHRMQLIASLTSPFARKVRIVASEKHIEYDLLVDNPWERSTRVPEHNPLGKVPVWILEDGKSLYDSRVIVEYLDAISPVSHLLPKEVRPRIAVRRWEALADGAAEAAATVYLERRRLTEQQSADWIERQLGKVSAALAAMNNELGENEWCVNNTFSLADIAVGCALGYLDFRFGHEIHWRRGHPNLAELYDRLMLRSSFKTTLPATQQS